jgi:hypothetical protein
MNCTMYDILYDICEPVNQTYDHIQIYLGYKNNPHIKMFIFGYELNLLYNFYLLILIVKF